MITLRSMERRLDPSEVTLQRLTYFVKAADEGGFREASRKLRVAQPGLSSHIRALENHLGIELFSRTGRARLTPAGKQLLPRARAVLNAAERLLESSISLTSGDEGVVSIACWPVHLERFLASVISDFTSEHPAIRVDLSKVRDDRRADQGRTMVEEVLTGDVDLAMGPLQPQPLADRLEVLRLYEAKLVLLVPNAHPFRHMATVSIDTLRGQQVLIAPQRHATRDIIETEARKAGFSLEVRAQSASPGALLALCRRGLGMAVTTDAYSLVGDGEFPYPAILGSNGESLSVVMWLQWRADEELLPAVAAFVDCARTWVERERASPRAASTNVKLG